MGQAQREGYMSRHERLSVRPMIDPHETVDESEGEIEHEEVRQV